MACLSARFSPGALIFSPSPGSHSLSMQLSPKRNLEHLPAWLIAMVVAAYLVSAAAGLPQQGTRLITEASGHPSEHPDSHDEQHEATPNAHDSGAPSEHGELVPPGYLWVTPFVLLLGAIAVLPLIRQTEHWWEDNLHRFYVAGGLGVVTLLYYAFGHPHVIEGHWPAHHMIEPTAGGAQWGLVWTVFANAILNEYIPFIVLLFSLYTISGGIRIEGDLQANPMTNASIMAIGGLLASFIGTTGAAMLLIRLLLETNKERKNVQHTVVFFIFIVCNCGGCLLPIGDPPLFLGYLRGVDFLWTFALWQEWLMVNGLLLVLYLILDEFIFYRREKAADIRRDITEIEKLRFSGLKLNLVLLLGVILSVALLAPNKLFPGTSWYPWMYLREVVQLTLVAMSIWLGTKEVRKANNFSYHAILEVAALFFGIFICMQPALQILSVAGPNLGITSPMMFFWITGGLSSVLDNAPTYVVFFETAKTIGGENLVAGVAERNLIAISLGAVFMGAMTYIGNGPNFMVKAIAERSGIRMPSFFGYVLRYSVPLLLPILALMAWQYLRQ